MSNGSLCDEKNGVPHFCSCRIFIFVHNCSKTDITTAASSVSRNRMNIAVMENRSAMTGKWTSPRDILLGSRWRRQQRLGSGRYRFVTSGVPSTALHSDDNYRIHRASNKSILFCLRHPNTRSLRNARVTAEPLYHSGPRSSDFDCFLGHIAHCCGKPYRCPLHALHTCHESGEMTPLI